MGKETFPNGKSRTRNYLRGAHSNMRLIKGDEPYRVLVLYTGGTIGMVRNQNGVYSPAPNAFHSKIRSLPELHDEFTALKIFGNAPGAIPEEQFVLHEAHTTPTTTICYKIKEYNPLLDSCNMSIDDWVTIAKDIQSVYNDYDGFVVLHGTDTLSYTAAALSFMLEGLGKTVVVTGSQIPIFESRSDAKENFHGALVFAAAYKVCEVCVYFAHQLFRGNRTLKSSSNMLNAFSSPNYPCLGRVGINYEVFPQNYWRPECNDSHLKVCTSLNPRVGILKIFPTITGRMVEGFLGPHHLEGVVFQSYGIGNIPSANCELLQVMQRAVENGVIIVNVSQCMQGSVAATYETGRALEEIGIIPGYDMTATAALAKLSYVLGMTHLTLQEKKDLMKMNLRGELTNH